MRFFLHEMLYGRRCFFLLFSWLLYFLITVLQVQTIPNNNDNRINPE